MTTAQAVSHDVARERLDAINEALAFFEGRNLEHDDEEAQRVARVLRIAMAKADYAARVEVVDEAKAPEMLKALRRIVAEIEAATFHSAVHLYEPDPENWHWHASACDRIARDAIAKAEGR